jgi:hypothetical protein
MTRPAVFLDRSGSLVEEVPYLHKPERLALLPEASTTRRPWRPSSEEARPAPAVTERAWPGMPVGRERARP